MNLSANFLKTASISFAICLFALGKADELIPIAILSINDGVTENSEKLSSTEIELFLKNKNIPHYRFQKDSFDIFVSKKLAPIEEFHATTKWLTDIQRSGHSQFSLDTLEGKALFDSISKTMGTSGLEVDSQDKFMELAPAFTIKGLNGLPTGQLSQSLYKPNSELKSAYLPPTTDKEVIKRAFETARAKIAPFPSLGRETEYVIKTFEGLRGKPLHPEALQAVGSILNQLGEELISARDEALLARNAVVANLLSSQIGDTPQLKGPRPFGSLPEKMKQLLKQLAMNSPEQLGFTNSADANAFLESNPTLDVEFKLSVAVKVQNSKEPGSNSFVSVIIMAG